MPLLSGITLIVNGITLSLSIGFLIIVLWQDPRKGLNQFFGVFLATVTLWSLGSLMALALSLIDGGEALLVPTIGLLEVGFAGSSVAVYLLTVALVSSIPKRFRQLGLVSLAVFTIYQLFLLEATDQPLDVDSAAPLAYRFQQVSIFFYLIFGGATLYLLWRYRQQTRSRVLVTGLVLFAVGQSIGLLDPTLGSLSFSIVLCSVAALITSLAILRLEVISPYSERIAQVEAMHNVSLAITEQLGVQIVLRQITSQAAGLLDGDGAGIFLVDGDALELATVYNMPESFVGQRLPLGNGVAGTVARTLRSIRLDNYERDWKQRPDLPLARETFGSVICVPLLYGGRAMGVLMVVAGRRGQAFQREDERLLELLAAQAAVALAHSRLFDQQNDLTHEIEAARNQLETVLSSTESPVIAVDRKLNLIFANPAARRLFPVITTVTGDAITQLQPSDVLPTDFRTVIRDIRRHRAYSYEIHINNKTYWCHLATLGSARIDGWVALLNDVTQLKELDRIKSEMIRMTSHDLKNPLQAALTNLDLLTDSIEDDDTEEIQLSLRELEEQLVRMHRIISGILDMERLKSGTRTLGVCIPQQIVDHTLTELRNYAGKHNVQLKAEVAKGLPNFQGDEGQFERALINLVDNAIKFSKPGGQVVVRARLNNSQIIFSVIDNGIGIPKAQQALVFDRFYQAKQAGAEEIEGTGLGLSLVQTIVELHLGKVWLESAPGEGTTFYIAVPALPFGVILNAS